MVLNIVIHYEKADTKLVALVKGYECGNNEKLLVQSPSGDIDIIVLFMLHCSGTNIFLNTGDGDARKIIGISCPILSKIEYQGLSGIYAFSGNDYISSLLRKGKKKFWKTLLKQPEYLDIFANLETNEIVQEGTVKERESFVCKLYGYKKLSSIISE